MPTDTARTRAEVYVRGADSNGLLPGNAHMAGAAAQLTESIKAVEKRLVQAEGFLAGLPEGSEWQITGLARKQEVREVLTALRAQQEPR